MQYWGAEGQPAKRGRSVCFGGSLLQFLKLEPAQAGVAQVDKENVWLVLLAQNGVTLVSYTKALSWNDQIASLHAKKLL